MTDSIYRHYANDPQQLLQDIDRELDLIPLEDFPLLPQDGEEPMVREVRNGHPKHTVMELVLDRSMQSLRGICCDKFKYCSQRKKHEDTVQLIQAVADTLISAYVKFPIPVGMIASYCVLSLFLDRICDCNGDGPCREDTEKS